MTCPFCLDNAQQSVSVPFFVAQHMRYTTGMMESNTVVLIDVGNMTGIFRRRISVFIILTNRTVTIQDTVFTDNWQSGTSVCNTRYHSLR